MTALLPALGAGLDRGLDRGLDTTGLPLLALRPGGSIASVLECRREQIERWRHTPESDLEKPVRLFLVDIRQAATAALEDNQFRNGRRQLRRRLVKLAALVLALIDRLDMEETGHDAQFE